MYKVAVGESLPYWLLGLGKFFNQLKGRPWEDNPLMSKAIKAKDFSDSITARLEELLSAEVPGTSGLHLFDKPGVDKGYLLPKRLRPKHSTIARSVAKDLPIWLNPIPPPFGSVAKIPYYAVKGKIDRTRLLSGMRGEMELARRRMLT